MLGIFTKGKWSRQELESFRTGSGGDMNGGHSSIQLTAFGTDQALLTCSDADWYYDDSEISEYLVDGKALTEIKEVFLKYGMQGWDGKKFSNIFVADGATTSYNFSFSDDSVHFSSQIFPLRYIKKLRELDDIIEKYKAAGEKLPGLALPERSKEEAYEPRTPENGKVKLEVYEYSLNRLYYRVLNGTEGELTLKKQWTLVNSAGETVASDLEGETYPDQVSANGTGEESISLEERLAPGVYELQADGYSCSFEIR